MNADWSYKYLFQLLCYALKALYPEMEKFSAPKKQKEVSDC
jgi:hypothetical protein